MIYYKYFVNKKLQIQSSFLLIRIVKWLIVIISSNKEHDYISEIFFSHKNISYTYIDKIELLISIVKSNMSP